MANPLRFTPLPIDPRLELKKRLDEAPAKHAEALLVAYDLLQTAHEKGILDLLDGAISGKDAIAGKLAYYAKQPGGINAIRNLLEGAKILMALDPETLEQLSSAVTIAADQHKAEKTPPSLWQIAKRATSEDSRRGLSFMTLVLSSVGKALK
ncbi:DUF1641 domain-containing protein [Granulicella sp. WH15]|uniref:DUF1641 domain-containing protein n=1 Tax=Granulicella sp. WH15 TaxID=2602070 RepID=UPI001366BE9B|nr:DUF1641 domain-containing protein [Granulicella sp. WH15]QHN02288.1 DUF1641 domain-containing protein [Granulicella sp. WH15]